MSHKKKGNKNHYSWGIAQPEFYKYVWVPAEWMRWIYPDVVEDGDDRDTHVGVSMFTYGDARYSVDAIFPRKKGPTKLLA